MTENSVTAHNSLGKFLKEKRHATGLKIRQFAAKIDSDQATWSKIENGHRLPPKDQLPIIADTLNITLEELKTQFYAGIVAKTVNESGLDEKVLKVAEKQVKYGKMK